MTRSGDNYLRPAARVTPASLRAECILEVGRAPGTSLLFVQTVERLHVFHAATIPDRTLDAYAVELAVAWIQDCGLPSFEVARNLDVDIATLRKALVAAGYERLTPSQYEQRTHARMKRKLGNRRGRLVLSSSSNPGASA